MLSSKPKGFHWNRPATWDLALMVFRCVQTFSLGEVNRGPFSGELPHCLDHGLALEIRLFQHKTTSDVSRCGPGLDHQSALMGRVFLWETWLGRHQRPVRRDNVRQCETMWDWLSVTSLNLKVSAILFYSFKTSQTGSTRSASQSQTKANVWCERRSGGGQCDSKIGKIPNGNGNNKRYPSL